LGLTPRRYQSGETDWSGRISKRGDSGMPKLLYEVANILGSGPINFLHGS
jgi:transposase